MYLYIRFGFGFTTKTLHCGVLSGYTENKHCKLLCILIKSKALTYSTHRLKSQYKHMMCSQTLFKVHILFQFVVEMPEFLQILNMSLLSYFGETCRKLCICNIFKWLNGETIKKHGVLCLI